LILNLIWMIVLGIKGNEWAWRSRKFESVEQFRETQAIWSKWGLIIFIVMLVLSGISFALGIGAVILGGGINPGAFR